MAEIFRYILVDADDYAGDSEYDTLVHEFDDLDDACDAAREAGGVAVVERVYVFSESRRVWEP